MTELITGQKETVKAVIAGLMTGAGSSEGSPDFEHSMTELKSLVEACDLEVCKAVTQSLDHPDSATYIGKGKAYELADIIKENEAEYCVFESNLSPAQMKNLQKIVGVPVWDRTNLILEIFSRRARTREAKLQVESAYLQFMLPRLTGMWQHLGRQSGGGGSRANKGIGETQLELDRRQINHRLAQISRELDTLTRTRSVQRRIRESGIMPSVALVGYTNAGKSSLMNCLLSLPDGSAPSPSPVNDGYSIDPADEALGDNGSKLVFEKDMLFATLDTSIRRIYAGDHKDFLLSDTVGFIENLPHGLIKAFRSTLEEVKYADLLLIVLDASDPYHKMHREVTEKTLSELGAGDIPRIYVMNKTDLLDPNESRPVVANDNTVFISVKTKAGIPDLLGMISMILYKDSEEMELLIPFSRGDLLSRLHEAGSVISEEYTENGTRLKVNCPRRLISSVEEFKV